MIFVNFNNNNKSSFFDKINNFNCIEFKKICYIRNYISFIFNKRKLYLMISIILWRFEI